jgi:ribonuclease HII
MLEPYLTKGILEAGCDEAGRGCLAGPVFAAAVILPGTVQIDGLNDSKQLTESKRYMLRTIIEKSAVAYAVASADPSEIDEMNILNASILAMHRALDMLPGTPVQILVDGNRFRPYRDIPHHCIIRGDGKYLSIAAASVLAKTCRDDFMKELDQLYPQYGWKKNKGYPTREHREALRIHGATPFHRKSFRLMEEQLKLPL